LSNRADHHHHLRHVCGEPRLMLLMSAVTGRRGHVMRHRQPAHHHLVSSPLLLLSPLLFSLLSLFITFLLPAARRPDPSAPRRLPLRPRRSLHLHLWGLRSTRRQCKRSKTQGAPPFTARLALPGSRAPVVSSGLLPILSSLPLSLSSSLVAPS